MRSMITKKKRIPWNKDKKMSEEQRKKLCLYTIEDIKELAKSRGGKCLSKKYINSSTPLKWQCKKGHTWKIKLTHINRGHWCPVCAGNIKKTIKDMKELAKSRGGKCLSKRYVNTKTKLKWLCKEKHAWEATPVNIQRGTWCPKCSEGKSERICRKYFEEIFDKKFIKIKPKWLKSKKGTLLELDGYCEDLGIAFEYQGKQHYVPHLFFNQKRSFKSRKELDKLKRIICKKRGIILIEIPYTIKFKDMDRFIIKECKKKGIKVPKITKKLDHELFDIYSPEILKEMQELAKVKGGKCLSKKYITARTKMKWKCEEGHTWEASSNTIKKGHWCPYCSERYKTIEDMKELAKSRGGKCLSKKYLNRSTKLKWQCKKGHIWKSDYRYVKRGSWCHICGREQGNEKLRTGIEKMQELAKSRGGKCLSKKYINSYTKLKWQCKKGHTWEAVPGNITRGRWCPYCGREQGHEKLRTGIEKMQELAKAKGGKCLSKKYFGTRIKLKWKCKKGHTWETPPKQIRQGHWCPYCARERRKKHLK